MLQALVRLFGVDRSLRRVRSTDFHVTTTGAIATTLWLEADFEQIDDGAPVKPIEMSRSDPNMIQVHYLPARRDPAEQGESLRLGYEEDHECLIAGVDAAGGG